jgi:hypothetical protein
MRKALSVIAFMLLGALNCYAQSPLANVGGKVYASGYARWHVTVVTAPTGTGAGSITVTPGIPSNQDGSQVTNAFVSPGGGIYTPITVGLGTANQETVTPTAVSGCNAGSTSPATCTLTATFANTHGPGDIVVSGDAGIQEAMNSIPNGGVVVVDNTAAATDAFITATVVNPKIAIEDTRQTAEQWWTPVGGTTAIAAPAVLTSTTVTNSTTPAGSYTNANAYVLCVAYVDIMGQEGACSPTYSQTPTAATGNSFTITAPVASTGAVGYTVYISLTNGTYQLAYKVPLVTQPTATGAYPVANGVCTLTTVETITPACSVANTVYGTTAASATVTALTLNTSPIDPQVTIVSTTSVYTPNAGGRTTYTYAPGSRAGIVGWSAESLPFTISAADTTTTPSVIGTINMRPGFMNYIGKTIRSLRQGNHNSLNSDHHEHSVPVGCNGAEHRRQGRADRQLDAGSYRGLRNNGWSLRILRGLRYDRGWRIGDGRLNQHRGWMGYGNRNGCGWLRLALVRRGWKRPDNRCNRLTESGRRCPLERDLRSHDRHGRSCRHSARL